MSCIAYPLPETLKSGSVPEAPTNAEMGLINTMDNVSECYHDEELVPIENKYRNRKIMDDMTRVMPGHAFWPNWCKPSLWLLYYNFRGTEHSDLGLKGLRLYYFNRQSGVAIDSQAAAFKVAEMDVLANSFSPLPEHLAKKPKIKRCVGPTGQGGNNRPIVEVDDSRGPDKRVVKRVRYV